MWVVADISGTLVLDVLLTILILYANYDNTYIHHNIKQTTLVI